MLKQAPIAAVLALTISTQASAETWLCIADTSSGLSFNKVTKKWVASNFSTDENRFVVKLSDDPNTIYEVNPFGESFGLSTNFKCVCFSKETKRSESF